LTLTRIAAALLLLTSASYIAAQTAFVPPKPLRIGVGGDYPDGLDGVLTSRGLPHERIFPWELADPNVLKQYDVLLLSCPLATAGSLDDALIPWVEAGGRVYVETWPGIQGAYPLPRYVTPTGTTRDHLSVIISAPDDPVVKGLDAKKPISLFHLTGTFLQPAQAAQATVLAQFRYDGDTDLAEGGAAVLSFPIGRGEVVYSGAPLSFLCFHRGPGSEPITNSIIDYLAQGRAVTRLTVDAGETPTAAVAPPAPARAAAPPAETAGLPPSFTLIDKPGLGAYNTSVQVKRATSEGDRAAALVLDGQFDAGGKATRPCLWLILGSDRIELRVGKTLTSRAITSARWQPPAQPVELLVQRRAQAVTVLLGDRELILAHNTGIESGGTAASCDGCVALTDGYCQPVADPVFADDFMRQPNTPDAWTPESGDWHVVGIGNEAQSINGFYLAGSGAATAVTGTGEEWWEDYAAGAAVRLEDGATCGLCILHHGKGDYLAFMADAAQRPAASLRLVRVRGGKEALLAQRSGGVVPGQWYRLTLRLHAERLEALLDGEPVLQCPCHEPRGGGMGLLVKGGSARFDDVLVQPATQPLQTPRHEGGPVAEVPTTLGPQDHLTWANPAEPWSASLERPSLLWHTGDFPGDLIAKVRLDPATGPALRRLILAPASSSPETQWLSATATVLPGAKQVAVVVARPGQKALERSIDLGSGGTLQLARRGGAISVLWNQEVILRTEGVAGMRRVGLEVDGPPVTTQSLQVLAPDVRDHVFGVAPTEWWTSAGTWEIASRWACDSRWSWFAGWGDSDFAVWNKRPVDGDVAVDYWVGVKMEAPGGPETTRCRDLNATLCGDKSDPHSGYSFVTGGDGGVKTQLFRNGVLVAECPGIRVPGGWGIHHEWFHVRIARIGHRIEMDFEGRPVFRYDDPSPLHGGYIGLWSRDSGILIPRVTIYH